MSEPIRIAQMMTDMNYGGVEMVVMNYYRHIDRSKIQFDFFALEGSSLPQKEEIERLGGRIYIVPSLKHIFEYDNTIAKIFKINGYKIVHSHMNSLSVFSLRVAKKVGISNRIAHNHSTAGKGETKKNIVKYLLRPFAKVYPTELCACSRLAGEWLYGRKAKFHVFNNAIELDRFAFDSHRAALIRKELKLEEKLVIGHIGRFCYQKNHSFLIDVFNEIHKRRPNSVLLLIGEGELEDDIKYKVERLGIDSFVVFMGKQDDTSMFYQAMDAFVLPSRYEGLPVVGVEAQASGIPCFFSDKVTGEAKILDSTFFVPFKASPIDWANFIIKKVENYVRMDTSDKMKIAGFDINEEAKKLLTFYEKLLSIS